MKIFVLSKRRIYAYLALLLTAVSIIFTDGGIAKEVFSEKTERILPIYCVDRGDEKLCSLTFDAAWDDSDTDELIKILEKYDAKATFFVVGDWAEKYSASVKKFFENGHEIANHSNTHPHITNLTDEKIKEEIKLCSDKIEMITKVRPTLFRGPYGEYNNAVIKAASELGHKTIQWDVDSLDWKKISVEEIKDRVTKRVNPGSIILFHNGVENTPAALNEILDDLTKDGYKFVTVSELIYSEGTIDHTGKQKETKQSGRS